MTQKNTAKKSKPPAPEPPAPARQRMFVGRQPIHEGGKLYLPGAEIRVPAARAKALGSLIHAREDAESEPAE